MRQTKTDESMARAQEAASNDPERAEVIARARRFKASWFELGEALTEVRKHRRYRQWGHSTFEDYCRRELHLREDTANKLTGAYSFLQSRAPEVLRRTGDEAPLPSYQAVDFWRRAEDTDAPTETVEEIRRLVVDEGTTAPRLSRLYRDVVFPIDRAASGEKTLEALSQTIDRLQKLLDAAQAGRLLPARLIDQAHGVLNELSNAVASKTERAA